MWFEYSEWNPYKKGFSIFSFWMSPDNIGNFVNSTSIHENGSEIFDRVPQSNDVLICIILQITESRTTTNDQSRCCSYKAFGLGFTILYNYESKPLDHRCIPYTYSSRWFYAVYVKYVALFFILNYLNTYFYTIENDCHLIRWR